MVELKQIKRSIEQNNFLERYKQASAKNLERIELSFQSTPLGNNKVFRAASANIYATKFQYKNNSQILPIIIGLIFGVLYVMISNIISSQKTYRKRN